MKRAGAYRFPEMHTQCIFYECIQTHMQIVREVNTHTYRYTHIYIYTERERERKARAHKHKHVHTNTQTQLEICEIHNNRSRTSKRKGKQSHKKGEMKQGWRCRYMHKLTCTTREPTHNSGEKRNIRGVASHCMHDCEDKGGVNSSSKCISYVC